MRKRKTGRGKEKREAVTEGEEVEVGDTHDNIDIAIDVVGLLQDLTDEDVLEDNDEPAQVLVDALIENNVLEFLV
ncbi:hypothetical protein F0562_003436 [Nyssa sinensis]|uniref:Beta-catenin-like protein 1 N-terminal domain-containing protein n=1 Tax=Nyssa sinensis TaxID=561372 RepID=A0A5J5BZC6_9ASTE|nr:hypothetical protein F0562_003436 [Nyssa sinensis]